MRDYRYDHVHLRSRDPDATARFFETMFGAEVTRSIYPPGTLYPGQQHIKRVSPSGNGNRSQRHKGQSCNGSPSHGGPRVRIHLSPAVSLVRTSLVVVPLAAH
jgi:catechol 2,3-dioxygenase-like lactoylglutathione lyase family enzyme